jgi:hypothetical protein
MHGYGKQYVCGLSGYDFEVYNRYREGSDSDDSEE